jgi:hypothetical protein
LQWERSFGNGRKKINLLGTARVTRQSPTLMDAQLIVNRFAHY